MTILQRLKQETLPWHAALERRVSIESRLQSRSEYAALLTAFYGFYAPVEARLDDTPDLAQLPLDWRERQKTAWLAQDLRVLGRDPAELPQCEQLPDVTDGPSALGCLYVLEGATLGGQVISRMLLPLGITPGAGGAFFHSYGERVGPMWSAFRQAVVDYSASTQQDDRLVAAATQTFQCFDAWLATRFAATT